MVRLQPDALASLDDWIAALPEPRPSRPEAIRILTAVGMRWWVEDEAKRPSAVAVGAGS